MVISCEPRLGNQPFEAGCDAASPNRNLAPITTSLDGEGRLEVGGCRLSDLARTYGTPLYVLDEATLRGTCRAYREALQQHYPGPSLALYASKANSSLAITALVAAEGLGLDAVSAGELLTALQGGMPAARIVLHGNHKSREELALAAERGVTVVADNWRDLELLAELAPGFREPVRLMLRFTPGIECHTHEYIRTGHLDSKFGFDPDQLETVLRHLQGCSWGRLTGLHAHIGSQKPGASSARSSRSRQLSATTVTPRSAARASSSRDLLLPCSTIRSGAMPPCRAVSSSPALTASRPKPSEATRAVIASELLALEA